MKTMAVVLRWLMLLAQPLSAQDAFPAKTITLVTPFAAGAGSDILTRILADFLRKHTDKVNFGTAGVGTACRMCLRRPKRA